MLDLEIQSKAPGPRALEHHMKYSPHQTISRYSEREFSVLSLAEKEAELDRLIEDIHEITTEDRDVNVTATLESVVNAPIALKDEYPEPFVEPSPDSLVVASHDELLSELETIYLTTKAGNYPEVRDRVLSLEFELNERQRWAPSARPTFSIPWHTRDQTQNHKLIQQDRVLIDCHWLHRTCKRQAVKEVKWQPLVDPRNPFPLELAIEFSTRAIKNAFRADEILCLSSFQQAQLRTMTGAEVRQARERAENAKPTGHSPLGKMLRTINQWASHDPRVNAAKYVALARAMSMLNGTKHTNNELGELVGLLLAQPPLKENTLRGLQARLNAAMERAA